MRTYGQPGATAAAIAARRRQGRLLAFLLGIAGLLLGMATGTPAIAIFTVLIALLIGYRLNGLAYAADAGAAAEVEVARRLQRLKPTVLLFDVDLRDGRSDVDTIILGPWVATVEVKRARGFVVAMDDGTVRAGRTWLPGRPVAQAAHHAARIGQFSDAYVTAVLCLTRMWGRARYVEYGNTEVLVTNLRRLNRNIRRLDRSLGARDAKRLATMIRDPENASPRAERPVH